MSGIRMMTHAAPQVYVVDPTQMNRSLANAGFGAPRKR